MQLALDRDDLPSPRLQTWLGPLALLAAGCSAVAIDTTYILGCAGYQPLAVASRYASGMLVLLFPAVAIAAGLAAFPFMGRRRALAVAGAASLAFGALGMRYLCAPERGFDVFLPWRPTMFAALLAVIGLAGAAPPRFGATTRRFALGGALGVVALAIAFTAVAARTVAPERPLSRDEQFGFFPSRLTLDARHLLAPDDFLGVTAAYRPDAPLGAADCAGCHPDITGQWERSAHRFSSFNNPWYDASFRLLVEGDPEAVPDDANHRAPAGKSFTGLEKARWCSGCHDPVVMATGALTANIDRAGPVARAGLTCLVCHRIDALHGVEGNAAYRLTDTPDSYPHARAAAETTRTFNEALIRRDPAEHKREMLQPFHRESDFCAACHKVSLEPPVNDYRYIRGQDEYDAWHDSGVALNAARTFYLPDHKRRCQDCHMPLVAAPLGDLAAKEGQVRSHHFPAAHTAMAAFQHDDDAIERAEYMMRAALRVDLHLAPPAPPANTNADADADDEGAPMLPPDEVELHVVVRNAGVGHAFPGGTIDSNEGWIQLQIGEGEAAIVVSGALDADGHLDPAAHSYRGVLVDEHGRRIHRRDAQNIRAPAWVRTIPPGTADVGRYLLRLPTETAGEGGIPVRARLLWRKFDAVFHEFAVAAQPEALREFPRATDLPVSTIHEVAGTLTRDAEGWHLALEGEPTAPPWMQANDWGIALLRGGDTDGARRAFEQARALAPERRDGPINLAIVAIAASDLPTARQWIAAASNLGPDDPRTAYWHGVLLTEEGRYGEAAKAFERALVGFPDDRDSWRRRGRALYLVGDLAGAIEAMTRVLEIDAEDPQAYYYRGLARRALGDTKAADADTAAYEKFQPDPTARAFANRYLQAHPDDALLAQNIVIHDLRPRDGSAIGSKAGADPGGGAPAQ